MKLLIIFLPLLFTLASRADAPDWIKSSPAKSGGFKFYVGRSPEVMTESKGYEEASRNAIEIAIRENFGFVTKLDNQSYEANSDWDYSRRIQESSKQVELVDFEQIDSHSETKGGCFSVWLLYRYPIASIEREKRRLERSQKTQLVFNEVGHLSERLKGGVQVLSDPLGAEIRIDGERWGVTPLRIYGQLSPGKHTLEIDHPSYKIIREQLMISPGNVVEISKKLSPAEGKLSINSNVSKTRIYVNGRYIDQSKVEQMPVRAGTRIQVEYVHEDYEKSIQIVEVGRDEVKSISTELVPKPAFVMFAKVPKGAVLYVDSAPIKNLQAQRWITTSAGSRLIEIYQNGEAVFTERIELHGGERRALSPIFNISDKPRVPASNSPSALSVGIERWLDDSGPKISKYFGVSFDLSGGSLRGRDENGFNSITLALGGNLRWPLGWELGISYDFSGNSGSSSSSGGSGNSTKKVELEGMSYFLGLPVYFRAGERTWLSLFGEVGIVRRNFRYSGASGTIESADQNRIGLGGGIVGLMDDHQTFWSIKVLRNRFSDANGRSGLESNMIRFGLSFGSSE
jgi:hypothetical protein